uniref:B-cell receptor CD22 n=1 Tax=Lates calcarifer TaxID=8187 RepID=A0A4W6EH38_LATCA
MKACLQVLIIRYGQKYLSKKLKFNSVLPPSVFVIKIQFLQFISNGWGVTYTSTEICALKGSTVDIHCTYSHPSPSATAEKRFWFTKNQYGKFVDLKTDTNYLDRVYYDCKNKNCTLTITDLRESDSAEYKFRFILNSIGYTGSPGVILHVTDLQVQVTRSDPHTAQAELKCLSSCPDGTASYIWYKNGQKMEEDTSPVYAGNISHTADSYYCAVKGYETFHSPLVCEFTSQFSTDINIPGSSVTLTCSSDANPAANYTWYKENGSQQLQLLSEKTQLVFSSIQSSDSGEYQCAAENELGRNISQYILINVKCE